jgi:hypothetical protein
MADDNVIPFRKRPPTEAEIEHYRMITSSWHPELRKQMFPEHFEHDPRTEREERSRK